MLKVRLELAGIAFLLFMILAPPDVSAGGVSPYLPLNTSPEIERMIERVLMLAGRSVMTRPIAVATVVEALHDARERDEELCGEVEMYLMRYMHDIGMTHLRTELSVSSGDSDFVIPNQHGKDTDSAWEVSGEFYYRLGKYALINLGGIAYDGNATPTGSMLSVGIDYAQLDIGYRDTWLSPFTDSSMLISTEAPTMPSITLSNYRPITDLGLFYQMSLSEMSESDMIRYQGRYTNGNPRLARLHMHAEPIDGYSFGATRQMQFSGGERGQDNFRDFIHAVVDPYEYDITKYHPDDQFGNQQASLTSRTIFPGRRPFAMYFEFAGEDFSLPENIYMGSVSFSAGMDIMDLWKGLDLTYETSEWQNSWYVHGVYQDGLTNEGVVVGHWFGDQRQFNDDAGGMSHMLRLGGQVKGDGYLQVTYRTLRIDSFTSIEYERMHELALGYSRIWRGQTIGAEISSGRDVHGEWFTRLSTSMDLTQGWWKSSATGLSAAVDDGEDDIEFLADIGGNYSSFKSTLRDSDKELRYRGSKNGNIHLGAGVMRSVSARSDLGVRIEWDRIEGYDLYSVRVTDYRFHLAEHFALNGFVGISRLKQEEVALGYYLGGGIHILDVMPKWDLCLEVRKSQQLSRTRLFKAEAGWPRVFYNIRGLTLYLSRRF